MEAILRAEPLGRLRDELRGEAARLARDSDPEEYPVIVDRSRYKTWARMQNRYAADTSLA